MTQSNGQPALVAIYNLDNNTAIPLDSKTDTFCSGGSWSGNGTLYNSGGDIGGVNKSIFTTFVIVI